jgi:hypothetical protein
MSSLIRMVADAPLTVIAKIAAMIKVAPLRMTPNSPSPQKIAAVLFKQLTMSSGSAKLTFPAQSAGVAGRPQGFT